MASINNWTFSGRLTKGCETKAVGPNSSNVTKFTVAMDVGFGDKKHTLFVKVNLWGKLGVTLSQYLVKGKSVAVTGPVDLNAWVGSQDGQSHTDLQVDAKDVVLLPDGIAQQHSQPVVEEVAPGEGVVF